MCSLVASAKQAQLLEASTTHYCSNNVTSMPSNLERLARRKKKQTRLTFDRAPPESSSPAMMSPKVRRSGRQTPASSFTSRIQPEEKDNDDDEESEDILSSATKTNFTQRGLRIKQKKGLALPTPAKSSQLLQDFGMFPYCVI